MITQKHPKCSALLPTQKNVEKEEEIILPHNSPFSSFSLFLYLSKYLRGQTLSLSPLFPLSPPHKHTLFRSITLLHASLSLPVSPPSLFRSRKSITSTERGLPRAPSVVAWSRFSESVFVRCSVVSDDRQVSDCNFKLCF